MRVSFVTDVLEFTSVFLSRQNECVGIQVRAWSEVHEASHFRGRWRCCAMRVGA